MVAGAADEIVQPGAFAAQDHYKVAGQVELVVVGCAALVQSDDPEVVALQVFQRTYKINHAGDAKVLGRAGAGFDGNSAERGRPALGQYHAVDSGAIGNPEQSAEILRIFDAIEREDEACGVWACRRRIKQIFNGERFLRADERDNALVRGRLGHSRELLARFRADADAGIAALRDEALQAVVLALAGNQYVIEAAAAGLEGFLDWMQAVENVHIKIVVGGSPEFTNYTSQLNSCLLIKLQKEVRDHLGGSVWLTL
jgi:hypothetical protein